MKKLLAIILACAIVFSGLPIYAVAEETVNPIGQEQVETEKPQKPEITDEMSAEDGNKLINEYNNQVEEYNKYVEEENNRRQSEYDKTLEEVTAHNNLEQLKVDTNKQDLEKQLKRNQRIAADKNSKLSFYTDIPNMIPTSWNDNTGSLITSSVEAVKSTNQYKVINLHIFLKDGYEDTYEGSEVTDNSFRVNQNTIDHMLRAEWETFTVGENDIISLKSENSLYPHNGAIFARYFEGYTNGYWVPTQEFVSTVNYVEDIWDDGPVTIFSYNEGSTDHQGIKNIFNVYTYTFVRNGEEPSMVEPYTPDFWEVPSLELLTPIDKMDLIRVEVPIEPEPQPEQKEEESKEEEKVDNTEQNKEIETKEEVKTPKQKDENKTTPTATNNNNPTDTQNKTITNETITTREVPQSTAQKGKLSQTGDNNSLFYWGIFIIILAIIIVCLGVYIKYKPQTKKWEE